MNFLKHSSNSNFPNVVNLNSSFVNLLYKYVNMYTSSHRHNHVYCTLLYNNIILLLGFILNKLEIIQYNSN